MMKENQKIGKDTRMRHTKDRSIGGTLPEGALSKAEAAASKDSGEATEKGDKG